VAKGTDRDPPATRPQPDQTVDPCRRTVTDSGVDGLRLLAPDSSLLTSLFDKRPSSRSKVPAHRHDGRMSTFNELPPIVLTYACTCSTGTTWRLAPRALVAMMRLLEAFGVVPCEEMALRQVLIVLVVLIYSTAVQHACLCGRLVSKTFIFLPLFGGIRSLLAQSLLYHSLYS
jgi:hypothetical protein